MDGVGLFIYGGSGKIVSSLGDWSFDSKDKYDGGWKANKRHGAFTYTFFNGEIFHGSYVEGCCPEFNDRQAAVRAAPDRSSAQARLDSDAKAASVVQESDIQFRGPRSSLPDSTVKKGCACTVT
jgi:hypothetical protein